MYFMCTYLHVAISQHDEDGYKNTAGPTAAVVLAAGSDGALSAAARQLPNVLHTE